MLAHVVDVLPIFNPGHYANELGVHLIVGHSHSFNGPIKRARQLIASGDFGAVKMIHALNFTDPPS